jgi:solute:Na+ symporter, SSS family
MLHPIDYLVIVAYLIGVVIFGIKSAGKQQSTKDYFLGSKELPWWAICFSIVATETSTLTVIGIPAVVYGGNMTFFQLTFGYLAGRILVSVIFLPRYMRGEMQTAYSYLGERFGSNMQRLSSVTFLATRLLADGVRLFATAIPIKIIATSAGFDIGYPVIILGIGVLTAIYTFVGGFKAVVWMDVVQMSLYVLGAFATIGLLLFNLPDGAISELIAAGKTRVFYSDFSLHAILTRPYVLITAVVGGGIFSMASHGTDQLIVQRLLSCKSLQDARKALIGSAFFVMGQFAIFLLVGGLLWSFYGGAEAASLGLTRLDEVFPKYIVEQLPTGLAGLVLAGILAAAMSTLSSSLNALASSSMTDVLGSKIAHLSPEKALKLSKWLTLGWAGIFIGFATLFENMQNPVVELGLSIASFTYGALLGAFLLGLAVSKVNEKDAMIAFVCSVVTMIAIIFGVWTTAEGNWIFLFNPGTDVKAAMELTPIAWPWYTTLGTLITMAVGSLLSVRHR